MFVNQLRMSFLILNSHGIRAWFTAACFRGYHCRSAIQVPLDPDLRSQSILGANMCSCSDGSNAKGSIKRVSKFGDYARTQ